VKVMEEEKRPSELTAKREYARDQAEIKLCSSSSDVLLFFLYPRTLSRLPMVIPRWIPVTFVG